MVMEEKCRMEENKWMEQSVIRASYRAVLRKGVSEEQLQRVFAECQSEMELAYRKRSLLTASLYRYGRFLFLYTEGVGERFEPDGMLASMSSVLQCWPGVIEKAEDDRLWVYMQSYYYHAVPANVGEWMQGRHPELRRGRIALLAPGKWEEYMEHHLALMKEGLIEGDRYHLISVHENVLFSYFEEPKTMTNLQSCVVMQRNSGMQRSSDTQGEPGMQSAALEAWLRTDPESHFVRFAAGQGLGPDQNFVFLPCCAGI